MRRQALAALDARRPPFHDCEVYASNADGDLCTLDVGDDVEAYLRALADDRSWGDQNTLQACADAFRCRVLLVTTHADNFELRIEPADDRAAVSEIWVGFHSECHYVAAVDVA